MYEVIWQPMVHIKFRFTFEESNLYLKTLKFQNTITRIAVSLNPKPDNFM